MTTGDVLVLLSRLEYILPQLTAVHVDALRLSTSLAPLTLELERLVFCVKPSVSADRV